MLVSPSTIPALPCAVKITRTRLSDGVQTVYEEGPLLSARSNPAALGMRRLRACRAHQTQSIGDQEGSLVLDNSGGPFTEWASGDAVRIEVRRLGEVAWTLLLEGYLGDSEVIPSGGVPLLTAQVVGLNSVVDLISLDEDEEFDDVAYTAAFDSLCATYLPGYTRTITASAAAGTVKFPMGTKLREALDFLRRCLNAADQPTKWEWRAHKDAATREILLYPRGAIDQGTIRFGDALEGTRLNRGSAYDVVNRSIVRGAVVPSQVIDLTAEAADGSILLDSTSDWAAQPFVALDTPLWTHTLMGDRSGGKDPPSLAGSVVRNSDNYDLLGSNMLLRTPAATVLRNRAVATGTLANLWNNSTAAAVTFAVVPDSNYYEIVAWDFGVGAQRSLAHATAITSAGNASGTFRLEGSNDDSAWTTLGTSATTTTPGASYVVVTNTGPFGPYRYYRLLFRSTGGLVLAFTEILLAEFGNLSTDATNPTAIQHLDLEYVPAVVNLTMSTTGNITKEVARFDFRATRPVAKVIFSHSESVGSALITLRLQRSDDGSAWEDIAVMSSSSSTVIDNVYLDAVDDTRYMRLVMVDERAGGSAASNLSSDYMLAFEQTATWGVPALGGGPLAGDAMRGSAWTWDVNSMVAHPAAFEETTWPAPRLALTVGRFYWFLYKPQSGASATSYWALDYGTDATTPAAALVSTNSGSTWSAIAANATLLHRTAFNNHELQAQADDAASQAIYANFVPGGVLVGSLKDDTLTTQDMVNKAAAAELAARKIVKPRGQIVLAIRPEVAPANPVTLDQDWFLPAGVSGSFDVLEAVHDVVPGARTTLIINDHPPLPGVAVESALSLGSQRTV